MLIGTHFTGSVKRFRNQRIQTKFLILGIPLAPLSDTILVMQSGFNTKKGIPIKQNSQSILAAYGRMVLTPLAAFILFLGFDHGNITFFIEGFVLAVLAIYMLFFYGRSTPQENEIREVIGDMTGVYAMPHWMEIDVFHPMLKDLEGVYAAKNRDWKDDLKTGDVLSAKLVYAIALLNAEYDSREECQVLKEMAADLYRKNRGVQTPAAV